MKIAQFTLFILLLSSLSISQSLDSLVVISNKAKVELKSPGFLFKQQQEMPKIQLRALPRLPMTPTIQPTERSTNECIRFHEYDNDKAEINSKLTKYDTSMEQVRVILNNLQEQSTSHGKNLDGIAKILEALAALIAALAVFKGKNKMLTFFKKQ